MKMTLIQGDCLEVMKNMKDDSVDISIVDPPYGTNKKDVEWGGLNYFLFNFDRWFYEIMRISKYGVIWFCSDKMIPTLLKNKEFLFHRLIYWSKPAGSQFAGASNNNIWYSCETILIFQKREWLNKKGKDSKYGYAHFEARPHKFKDFNHSTVKPLKLIRWLIEHYTDKDDLLLDPFLGSGTTMEACLKLNRDCIGIEINPKHIETTKKRLNWGSSLNLNIEWDFNIFSSENEVEKSGVAQSKPSPTLLASSEKLKSDITRTIIR